MWWWNEGIQYDYLVNKTGSIIALNEAYECNNTESIWYQIVTPSGKLPFVVHITHLIVGNNCWTSPLYFGNNWVISFSYATFAGTEFIGVIGIDMLMQEVAELMLVS